MAHAERLSKREAELIKACELANQDPEVAAIEREMDALSDPIEGAWN